MAVFACCITCEACTIAAAATEEAEGFIEPTDDVAEEPGVTKSCRLLECCPACEVAVVRAKDVCGNIYTNKQKVIQMHIQNRKLPG